MDSLFANLYASVFGAHANIFVELAFVLIIAGVAAYILHFLRQPSIIAYIVAGMLIGPLGLYQLNHGEILHGLSEIGITLLLFMVGLDLEVSQLKRIGKAAVVAGVGQIVLTCSLGFGIAYLLGFSSIAAWYIALGLTFSSTIIVVKLLSEKKDMQSLYGKLAIGILLLQDVMAIFVLIFISGLTGSQTNSLGDLGMSGSLILTLAKAFMAGVVVLWLSRYVFPKIIRNIDKSDELMLIFGLGWSLGLAALFSSPLVGFNAAIGGFIAGLALANTGVHHQISGRIKSLRDFFIIIFFIVLGSQLVFDNIGAAIIPALLVSLFVLLAKPIIVMVVLGITGYKPRTSFFTGITLAQISEFSFILMALGLASGHVTQTEVTIVTLAGIITIAVSSYGVLFADRLYKLLHKPLSIFALRNKSAESFASDRLLKNHIVLIGAHRLGAHIINALGKSDDDVLIVDFNPDVIHAYQDKDFLVLCGDIADPYIQEIASLESAKLVISTVPDFKDTMALLEYIRGSKKHIRTIVAANDESEAEALYRKGADYVLLPHFIGGLHLADIIKQGHDLPHLRKLKTRHLKTLTTILKNR